MSFLSWWMLTMVLGPSLTGSLSLSDFWQKFTLRIGKEDNFLHYSNISEFDFTGRLKHPFSCWQWLCPDVGSEFLECTETFMMEYFYFKEILSLFSSYYISDATLCKFMQVNNSLIEINSVKAVGQYGLYYLKLKINDTIHCKVCIMEPGVRLMGNTKIYTFSVIFKPVFC